MTHLPAPLHPDLPILGDRDDSELRTRPGRAGESLTWWRWSGEVGAGQSRGTPEVSRAASSAFGQGRERVAGYVGLEGVRCALQVITLVSKELIASCSVARTEQGQG